MEDMNPILDRQFKLDELLREQQRDCIRSALTLTHGNISAAARMLGLARQLRTKLHHDPLTGAYEAAIAITGKP